MPEPGTWIKRSRPTEHRCQLPELNQGLRDKLTEGDQWQCNDCHTVWTVSLSRSADRNRKPWKLVKAAADPG